MTTAILLLFSPKEPELSQFVSKFVYLLFPAQLLQTNIDVFSFGKFSTWNAEVSLQTTKPWQETFHFEISVGECRVIGTLCVSTENFLMAQLKKLATPLDYSRIKREFDPAKYDEEYEAFMEANPSEFTEEENEKWARFYKERQSFVAPYVERERRPMPIPKPLKGVGWITKEVPAKILI